MQNVFKQIEDGARFAALGEIVLLEKKKNTIGHKLMHQTGELPVACRDRRKTSSADETWTNFKSHFTEEHQDYKDDSKTKTSGQFKANQVLQDTTNHALNQLMEATRRDEEHINSLREQNSYLMSKMTAKNSDTADLKLAMQALHSAVRNLGDKENSTPTRSSSRIFFNKLKKSEHYCYYWSHGRTGSHDHTSNSCANKKDGHKDCAFMNDRKGGSDKDGN